MKFLISPSKKLYYLCNLQKPPRLVRLPLKDVDSFISNHNTLIVASQKTLLVYHFTDEPKILQEPAFVVQGHHFNLNFQTTFAKKIQSLCFESHGIFVSDKYGDLFSIKNNQKEFINENFAIPRFIHYVDLDKLKYLIVGDEYYKIKIYDGSNPLRLISVWIPFQADPVEMLAVNQTTLVYLSRIVEKDSDKCRFQLHQLDVKQLENEQFEGKPLQYQSHMANTNFMARLCRISQQSFCVICLTSVEIIVDEYTEFEGEFKWQKRVRKQIRQAEWCDFSAIYDSKTNQLFIIYGQENEQNAEQIIELSTDPTILNPKQQFTSICLH